MTPVPALFRPSPHFHEQKEKRPFRLEAPFSPSGDQPHAIESLAQGLQSGMRNQVLLGVTGSGKTYTMACLIERLQRPTLIMAHNKILAAQLYEEFKAFFPHNAVEYFVSYYDYYQPEAYVPRTDTYIAKESTVNEQIDRMRHSATRSLLERTDVIIVASVSCIYGIGAVETYSSMILSLQCGERLSQKEIIARLVDLQYKRGDISFSRGAFRVQGDTVDIWPSHLEERAWRLSLWGDDIEKISEFDPLTGEITAHLENIKAYGNSHYVAPQKTLHQAIAAIETDLHHRLVELKEAGKLVEAQRLEQRTNFDMEMLRTTGMCQGIENYSRYLSGRPAGSPPPTLFEYLPEEALLFVDESHVTIPQIGAMYKGDASRKSTLSEHGFRLPSCADNRPLKFEEWEGYRPLSVFVSATPGPWELEQTEGVFVEQVIRPTGLIDPPVEVRPARHQVDDLLATCRDVVAQKGRVLVTALTKKMAEDLTEYFDEKGLRVRYMHADTETLERIQIIHDLRAGVFDILIGINLLREGLDIPECRLVAILDADKEGFLRSQTSLIQTIGRAARNAEGYVILYGDKITNSMKNAIAETDRRRLKQQEYNQKHHITPRTTLRQSISENGPSLSQKEKSSSKSRAASPDTPTDSKEIKGHLQILEKKMLKAANDLEFETAALLRDEIAFYRTLLLEQGDIPEKSHKKAKKNVF